MDSAEQSRAIRVQRSLRYADEVSRECRDRLLEDDVDPLLVAYALAQRAFETAATLDSKHHRMVVELFAEFVADSMALEERFGLPT